MRSQLRVLIIRTYCAIQAVGGIILSIMAMILYNIIPALRQPPPPPPPSATPLLPRHNLTPMSQPRRYVPAVSSPLSMMSCTSSAPSESPSAEYFTPIDEPPHPEVASLGSSNSDSSLRESPPPSRRLSLRLRTRRLPRTLPTLQESSLSRTSSSRDPNPSTAASSPTGEMPSDRMSRSSSSHESDAEASTSNHIDRVFDKQSFRLPYLHPRRPDNKRSGRSSSMPPRERHEKSLTRTLMSPLMVVTSLPHLHHSKGKASTGHHRNWSCDSDDTSTASKRRSLPLPVKKQATTAPTERTRPYEAPYFFPTPCSPDAADYVRKARANVRYNMEVDRIRTLSPEPSTSSLPVSEETSPHVTFDADALAMKRPGTSSDPGHGEMEAVGPRRMR
ncbi:hypothetical protein EVG20_g10225 [Dentipellis fragilis]|uniref:Uncharacterized protein n=1 Tax=Dentipellis fragilis TaxID=205917 RepID=A0A4Y9XTV4_9AGAM|nr:hypothetical protein EVG20_g10225 [Dentipellis fragilis]